MAANPKGQEKKVAPGGASIRARDRKTLSRIVQDQGPEAVAELVKQVPLETSNRGAKKRVPLRHSMMAALYLFRRGGNHFPIRKFARDLNRCVSLRYARSVWSEGPNYTEHKNLTALEQDLRRALSVRDERTMLDMLSSVISWRFTTVNPRWGFYVFAGAHLLFEPRQPAELHVVHTPPSNQLINLNSRSNPS